VFPARPSEVERFDPEAVGEEKLERRIGMACGLQHVNFLY